MAPEGQGQGPRNTTETETEADAASSAARGRRANNACTRCRERKVKCSGSLPCANCLRKSVECVFDKEDRKVVVSERFLNDLKRKSGYGLEREHAAPTPKRTRYRPSASPGDHRDHDGTVDAHESPTAAPVDGEHQGTVDDGGTTVVGGEVDNEEPRGLLSTTMRNPLASGPSKFVTDASGRRRWLGPSSTWAYSRQVLNMIQGHLGQHESPEIPLNVDAQAFRLDWPSSRNVASQTTTPTADIPSLDYALYLTNTVKFHLGQTYHLFDEEGFMAGLHDFYRRGPSTEPPADARLWYIQFLLIMAFGKALLVPGNPAQTPPGSGLVTRALELLPDVHGLYRDPVLSVEILCCLALYLQSVDHRNSAYTYIGQAFRIALTQGLHREPLQGLLNDAEANRLRCIWWTLYILDRKLSSLMGAPNSIQDSDITVQLPRSDPAVQKHKALGIHVALSRLLAKVLNTVYGVDGRLDPSFLKSVQEVLRDMAALAPQLTAGFEFKLNSSEPASRVAATLNLCYHQCVVLATRPLLMCLLQHVLAQHGSTNRGLARPIKALLTTSSESASKSLRILSALQSQHLLESFLPFDLEQTFSAAFVLTLMTAVPGLPTRNGEYVQTAFGILDTMMERGNVVARYRREELKKLQEMLHLAQARLFQAAAAAAAGGDVMDSTGNLGLDTQSANVLQTNHVGQDVLGEGGPATGSSTANGLASEQMLSIAGLLDWEPSVAALQDDQLAGNWLWTDSIAPDFDFGGELL